MEYAYDAGVTVIAATGNDGYTNRVYYPAAYATTIAVGAVDLNGDVSYYSNQGDEMDIAAPGGDTRYDHDGDGYSDGILQETDEGSGFSYYFYQGTSMASPHVAGVAALVFANGIEDVDDIRTALEDTAEDLGDPGWDTVYGSGLVDAAAAVAYAPDAEEESTLEILQLFALTISPRRAFVRWTTSVDADTRCGVDSTKETYDETLAASHRCVVMGFPGNTVEYVIESTDAEGNTATDSVTLTF